jgi:hydroxymethylbilane synthase
VGVLTVRIGARSSRLSQAQTAIVSDLIKERFGDRLTLEFVPVKTLGDLAPPAANRSLGRAGAKGAFTGDIEALLLDGKIDIAIHSMKDLTSDQTEGLTIGATPKRSDPRDALVTTDGKTIRTLPRSSRVGTSSLRRKAHLLKMRRDLEVVELHGNVDTRLRKVIEGDTGLDAIVLAVAGLERIGEVARISQRFSIDEMVPAVGQGIIAVQMRKDDRDIAKVLAKIDDEVTGLESRCERAFAQRLGADCNVPVGGCARVSGAKIRMVGMLAKKDGSEFRQKEVAGPSSEAVDLGTKLAEELLEGARTRGGAAS